jgi:hypothetical protein
MKALDVLNDFLKLSAFGEAPQVPTNSAPTSNMVEAPIMSGQPPIRPTIASNSPVAVAESRPATQPLKPATDLKNFKIK